MEKSVPVLIVLSGPAGSGKSTLCERLVAEYTDFSRVVTATTRSPRPGESDGVHYRFFSPDVFKSHIERGDFIEWALVHGGKEDRMYGTLSASIIEPLRSGRSLVMNVDVQGVETMRKKLAFYPELVRAFHNVFVKVCRDMGRQRMEARGGLSQEEIENRLRTADRELIEATKYDFVIESTTREADFSALLEIIKQAQAISALRRP